MKILNVRFQNLNSLVGEWNIDFTLPAYTADGIFAITGPTGAGKTTILDAICLAIYGRTPRLSRVTKSGNEVMSRQTGECFAEVTFETQAGRFRCHWAQHRARRKPEGELQVPRQEIANADTGEIVEVKKRGVADQIEAVTGMDFDRFTRSMMLAQGGFAAFLQAAPDERAPILEQITGTAIYSEISIRVHERHRQEQDALALLKAEVAGVQPLKAEEERSHREQLEAHEAQSATLARDVSRIAEQIAWLRGINALIKSIADFKTDENNLNNEMTFFSPKREQLAAAQSAAALDGQHATLNELRQQQARDRAALAGQNQALPEMQESHDKSRKAYENAQQGLANVKAARKDAEPLISKVRALDQRIGDANERFSAAEQQYAKEEQTVVALREAVPVEEKRLSALNETRFQLANYFESHAQDQWLVANFTGLEANLLAIDVKQHDIKQGEADKAGAATALEHAQQALVASSEQCATAEQKLTSAEQQLSHASARLDNWLSGKLLREYRAEKESLLRELGLLKQIADLADHRAHLEDGKPCPLCGSQEHPYAEGNIPAANTTEDKIITLEAFIAEAEAKEQTITVLQEEQQSARESVQEANNQRMLASAHHESARSALHAVSAALEKSHRDSRQHLQSLETKLAPLGLESLTGVEIDALIVELRERRDKWLAAMSESASIEQQEAAIQAELERLTFMIEAQGAALENTRLALNKNKDELAQYRQQRAETFGNRNPDKEMATLEAAVNSAERDEQAARIACTRLSEKVTAAKARAGALQQDLEQRQPRLKALESEFKAVLVARGFADEEQFRVACMNAEQRTRLLEEAQALDTRRTQLQARIKDRQAQLATEEEKQLTREPLEGLQQQHEALGSQHQEVLRATGSIKHALQKNEEAKTLLSNRQAAIEAQSLECQRWGNLHVLIGSSDGKKYRNFAQGLTFEMMVGHANRQLQKMTDRYLLVRDPAQPLELNVVDNYQAGEMRSTKNLSGGESFIVSLSLALGLSQMASRNVRVDSLFLDEGFGTLDEEALDTALETLSGLQQEGKLIGVISHVQALKERISTQIEVAPETGGRSHIAGPGCSRL